MIVAKSIEFDAAHFLPGYKGKCSSLHGHRWRVEIGVEGRLDPTTGMVIDFTLLKDFLNTYIMDNLDHSLLNDKLDNPTAENLVVLINSYYLSWRCKFASDIKLKWIKVWETEDSYALLSY